MGTYTGEPQAFWECCMCRNTASLNWKGQIKDKKRKGCQASKILQVGNHLMELPSFKHMLVKKGRMTSREESEGGDAGPEVERGQWSSRWYRGWKWCHRSKTWNHLRTTGQRIKPQRIIFRPCVRMLLWTKLTPFLCSSFLFKFFMLWTLTNLTVLNQHTKAL